MVVAFGGLWSEVVLCGWFALMLCSFGLMVFLLDKEQKQRDYITWRGQKVAHSKVYDLLEYI